jgi:hypothetical protein
LTAHQIIGVDLVLAAPFADPHRFRPLDGAVLIGASGVMAQPWPSPIVCSPQVRAPSLSYPLCLFFLLFYELWPWLSSSWRSAVLLLLLCCA